MKLVDFDIVEIPTPFIGDGHGAWYPPLFARHGRTPAGRSTPAVTSTRSW
jgi:hypothetical protein